MLDLYSLLPTVLRIRDTESVLPGEDGVLQRIVAAFQEEAEVTKLEIDGLADLANVRECPIEYLPLIAKLLGIRYTANWSEEKRRIFVMAAGYLWHTKGSKESWKAILQSHSFVDYFPWELWKHIIYETTDYSLYPDYDHPFKAARVDIRRPTDVTGKTGRLDCGELVEPVRAAHILIRREAKYIGSDDVDEFMTPEDTDYDGTSLVSLCAASRIVDDVEAWSDGGVYLPGETPASGEWGLEIEIYCSGWACQSSCTGSCTTGACQLLFGCQGIACQVSACMVGCQVTCEQGACETDPQVP